MNAKPTVRILYSRGPEYRLFPATGVYGGPTPTGEIQMEFFIDHLTIPQEITFAVNPDGKLGEEVKREPPERTITRQLQIAVLMAADDAEEFARWLADKIEVIRKARGGADA